MSSFPLQHRSLSNARRWVADSLPWQGKFRRQCSGYQLTCTLTCKKIFLMYLATSFSPRELIFFLLFIPAWCFVSYLEGCKTLVLPGYPCVPVLHPVQSQEGIMICHQGEFINQKIMPQCFYCPFQSKAFFLNDAVSLFSWEQFTADIIMVIITTYIYIEHRSYYISASCKGLLSVPLQMHQSPTWQARRVWTP